MPDDDEAEPPPTFESLFDNYSNYVEDSLHNDNTHYDSILLSQSDYWMKKAKIIKQFWGTTDTGLAYMKFKKWRMDYEDYLQFLEDLCSPKSINIQLIKDMLVEAGKPQAAGEVGPQIKFN